MKNIRVFLSENYQFLEVKFSVYLNRRVFVMISNNCKSTLMHILIHTILFLLNTETKLDKWIGVQY